MKNNQGIKRRWRFFSRISEDDLYSYDLHQWRILICNAVYYFFIVFGMIAYIPSFIASWNEGFYNIIAVNSFFYLIAVVLTFNRKIPYFIRALFISLTCFLLGFFLFYLLGPQGAGGIYMFASTLFAAFLLGNAGSVTFYILNVIAQVAFYFLLKTPILAWQSGSSITASVWLIKGSNFIVLNGLVVIVNFIFLKGFRIMLKRAEETRNATIFGLAALAEHRDNNTGDHLLRIGKYVEVLTNELAKSNKYKNYITRNYCEDVKISSILHDIGKVGIPDSILLKPDKLSDEEFNIMKMHPDIGSRVISEIEDNIDGRSLYALGLEIAACHHEKWDGSGYPKGLKGEEIPLSARITALADVYDALRSKRPYKEVLSHNEVVDMIKQERASHFDPEIVDAFLKIEKQMEILSNK